MRDFLRFCKENGIAHFIINGVCYAYCGGDYYLAFDSRSFTPKVYHKVDNYYIFFAVAEITSIECFDGLVWLGSDSGVSATYGTEEGEAMHYFTMCMYLADRKYLWDCYNHIGLVLDDEDPEPLWLSKSEFIVALLDVLDRLIERGTPKTELEKIEKFIRGVENTE